MPSAIPNNTILFVISPNASLAEWQKCLLSIAHITKPALFKNLTKFSKHQRQHFRLVTTHFSKAFSALAPSIFLVTYSKTNWKTHTIDSNSEPSATVPKWYLNNQVMPVQTGWWIFYWLALWKYQIAVAAPRMKSRVANRKARIQNRPNRCTKARYLIILLC